MFNSFKGISEIRILCWIFGSNTTPEQQTQEQKGEHKSIPLWLLWSEPCEIEVDCSELTVALSSQGIADKVNVIIDNIIATIFIEVSKITKY